MDSPVSREEASRALREIDQSREAIRRAIRAHRGHFHLWLWGAIWIAMALAAHFYGQRATRSFPFFVLPGVIASTVIGIYQGRQIRAPFDKRFLAALACMLVFGLLWPVILGGPRPPSADIRLFAFIALLAMQVYVLAGIWFDSYLLTIGLVVSVLILIGLFVFPQIFWVWFAIFCGGPVVLYGFLVRFWWR
jgi:hypothetical protein